MKQFEVSSQPTSTIDPTVLNLTPGLPETLVDRICLKFMRKLDNMVELQRRKEEAT
jgi:hypothetical protein